VVTLTRLDVTLYLYRLSSFFKKRLKISLVALIYRLKEFFFLLGSTSPVRDIILQHSLVSMFLPNGLFSPYEWYFYILLWSNFKDHPVLYKFVVSVSCCYITIYSFFTVSKAVSHSSPYESHFC